jgi:hypothetical protein
MRIYGNQVISAHAISAVHPKIIGSVRNENLFVKPAAKGHFSGYVRLPKNFSTTPAAIFASPIDIEKLINAEGPFLVKLRGCRFRFKRLLHLSDVSRL